MPKPDMPHNQILQGDCINVMQSLLEDSIDLVFADPPYNLQLRKTLHRPNETRVDGVDAAWDHFASFADYDAFTHKWLKAVRRVMKPNGCLWVIGSYHNIYRVGAILQNLGFWIVNDVIWVKRNPMPNFRGKRFTNAHETLLWCAYDEKSRYCFNYDAMKISNDDLQMRSDWHLAICNGGERLKNNDGRKLHPTQKPESLLQRVILSSSKPGDVILDPFCGTGTTPVVAKHLHRNFIGIEQDPAYCKATRTRLRKTSKLPDLATATPITNKREEVRISFGQLVEAGIIKPGAQLSSICDRYQATVGADGSVIARSTRGSIHKIGASLQGASSCNGWKFWKVQGRKPVVLDDLRQKMRDSMHTQPSGLH
ncbi:MAG: site-specific DNA-methyltransferase [Pseudomonadota bacterium]